MISLAIKSMKDDIIQSFFYWFTYIICSSFIFIFFHISMSVGFTITYSSNNMTTFMSVLVILICMIVIFFANDFYVKKKAHTLGVQLVCGGTFFQLLQYLFIQTTLIILSALPIGIALGMIGLSVLGYTMNMTAIISTIVIICIVLLYTTVLNLGYCYRHNIYHLINNKTQDFHLILPNIFLFKDNTLKIVSVLLYVLSYIIIIYNGYDKQGILVGVIVGMIGFSLSINHLIIPTITEIIKNKDDITHKSVIILGLLRSDIKDLKKNIILLIISDVIFISIYSSTGSSIIEKDMAYISFYVIHVLLLIGMMFQYGSMTSHRNLLFQTLYQLGFTKTQLINIMKKEVVYLYIFIGIILLAYMFIIKRNMILGSIIPMGICMIINIVIYRKNLYFLR